MLGDLDAALDRAQSDKAAVVLRSSREGIFSAGFDLEVFASNDPARSLEMVKAGAELALRLMAFPNPTIGVMEGHAFPMGTFLLLACDVRIGALGKFRMGLNEVTIGISPPRFAIELARSRVHPAWLSRTVTLGEMFEPEDAVTAGFLDRAVPPGDIDRALSDILSALADRESRPSILQQAALQHPVANRTRLVATAVKAGARGSFAGIRRGASYSSHRSDYWIYAN